jgi:hypothetical protein
MAANHEEKTQKSELVLDFSKASWIVAPNALIVVLGMRFSLLVSATGGRRSLRTI